MAHSTCCLVINAVKNINLLRMHKLYVLKMGIKVINVQKIEILKCAKTFPSPFSFKVMYIISAVEKIYILRFEYVQTGIYLILT